MTNNISTALVPDSMNGVRLDNALSLFLPNAGVRIRKRLFETHTVLVNGIPRSKGHIVASGDQILLVEKTEPTPVSSPHETSTVSAPCEEELHHAVYIVHEDEDYAAIYKPGGMHTAAIAGKNSLSLEAELPRLFARHTAEGASLPILINRLDNLTSGMVIAAKTQEAADKFRELEDFGAVEKLYLLLVHGAVPAPLQITNKLDVAKRKITRVLTEADPDPLRHTTVLPLLETTVPDDPSSTASMLMAAISKGARHQIRAHIASQGYPIVGDPLYTHMKDGKIVSHPSSSHTDFATQPTMYLHHYQIEIGSFSATCPPPWNDWEQWKTSIPPK